MINLLFLLVFEGRFYAVTSARHYIGIKIMMVHWGAGAQSVSGAVG